jgi:hypothetical protein
MDTPEMEDAIWNTIAEEERKRNSARSTATPELAQRVGQIHNLYPFLPTGVKLSTAKAGFTDEQIRQIAIKATPVIADKKPKKSSGLFGKIQDSLKAASRYAFAAGNFPVDFVQGGIAQIFDKNEDVGGWFISTDLGSMIANGDEAGTGFFIGGRAKELQAERARRYRGEINGEGFTIGRGLASTFLEPNTTQYRVLSGAVDALLALKMPVAPLVGPAAQAARVAQEAGSTSKIVGAVADVSRTVGKGSKEVGLTKLSAAERNALREQVGLLGESVDLEQANRFFSTGFGRRIIQRTAETKDFSETWDLWGRKIDPATAMRLTEAKTEQEVMANLLDVLGTEVTNTANIKGGRRVYRSLAQRNALIDQIPFGEGVSRAFAKIPRTNINLYQAETPRDQIDQLETLDRALKLFKVSGAKMDPNTGKIVKQKVVDPETGKTVTKEVFVEPSPLLDKAGNVAVPDLRKDFINRAAKVLVSKNEVEINKFYDDLEEEAKKAMVRFGTPREMVDTLYANLAEYTEDTLIFDADELGQATDGGFLKKVYDLGDDADDIVVVGPQTVGEIGKREFFIPDPKQVRRLTNRHNWIWVKKDPNLAKLGEAGQLRLPLAIVESIQENVWRKLITLTGGNFFRNTVDSQISIALSGKAGAASPFTHPFQWWEFVSKQRGKGDFLGQDWGQPVAQGSLDNALRAERAAKGDIVAAYFQDPLAVQRRATKLGIFKPYTRRLDKVDVDVARAHGDELGRLNADWSFRALAQGKSIDEIMALVRSGDEEAARWYKTINDSFKNGKAIHNKTTRKTTFERIDLDEGDNLQYLLESNLVRLDKVTGKNLELLDVVGQGRLTGRIQTVDAKYIAGDMRVGGRVEVTTVRTIGKKKVKQTYLARVESIDDTAKGTTFNVSPFAFDGAGDNSIQLEELLRDEGIYMDPNMPQVSVGEIRDPRNPQQASLVKSMDRVVNAFHSYLYTKPIGELERAPAFKSLYYEWVEKLAVSLDETSLNKIIDDISDRTNDPENYLTPGLWAKLQDLKANPDKLYGTLNADEVSSFASGSALDEYQKMVYNAVDRRNFTDVMRLISPFAQQQAEFLGRLARFSTVPVKGGELGYLPNANTLRKMQLIVEGGRDTDPDGDGRGFFYKDPTNGQWSFSFPLTGNLTKMLTGVDAQLAAPVKGLFLGLDVRPGLGPMATVAASALLKDTPSLDFVRSVLLPYGEKTNVVGALTPSYVQKIYDGITGQTNGRFFANTYAETMQALASTGKYDLANPNDRDRLLEEARDKARILVVLRGLTQFTGPAAGDYDVKVETAVGDIHTSGLAAALQSLRNQNYDNANLRFIEIFGEDAFTYLSGKTVSEAGGLEASKQFGDFERTNESLFRQYKDVAGYFGPVGTDFDFEVYTRQLRTGLRRRLTPEEILNASQKAIGLAYYRDMKEYLGTNLNKQSRQYLADYKKKIVEKYPGFAEMQYDPTETPRNINKLFQAAKRDDLQDNQAAQAILYYEKIRNEALAEANNRGFQSLKSDELGDLHEYLASYAEALIEQYPEFARVYDRLLSQEID